MGSMKGYMGYTPDRSMMIRTLIGEALGRDDVDLTKEQMRISRSLGISPEELSQINTVTKFGGITYNPSNLLSVAQLSQNTYGNDADSKRILDVLHSINEIQKQMLTVGVDTKHALEFSNLPALIMGVNSTWGRIGSGEHGMDTLQGILSLGNPQSPAANAMLFMALGQNGLFGREGFLYRKAQGLLNPDNFEAVLKNLNKEFLGRTNEAQSMFQSLLPQNMDPEVAMRLAELVSGKGIDVETKRRNVNKTDLLNYMPQREHLTVDDIISRWREIPQKTETEMQKILGIAGDKITDYEKKEQSIRELNLESAKNFYKTMLDAEQKSAEFWTSMSHSSKLQEEMMNTVNHGYQEMTMWMARSGFIQNPELLKEAYDSEKIRSLHELL